MNNTIKLAVASALLAAASSASAAGGIVAGDWTLDIGGVVNAYYTSTKVSGDSVNSTGTNTASNITTGLLPNYLAVSGKTRQNDLDVAFTISINPGASTQNSGNQGAHQENRQAFLTFGDASWGSFKLGKDLGIYASDAILNDMTLLGVGHAAGLLAGNTTTLGSIGAGYMYADWKSQVAYTSPNFNGFQFTAGVTQAFDVDTAGTGNFVGSAARGGKEPAFEGKASYAFAADQVNGKVWVSGISQNLEAYNTTGSAWDLGATVSAAGFGLTGYYGEGKGTGMTVQFAGAVDADGVKQDSKDWYLQATYTLPGVGTKLGARYGESELDQNQSSKVSDGGKMKREMWAFGAYHPITKHLNLVAEYVEAKNTNSSSNDGCGPDFDPTSGKAKTVSLGAILFF
ncbi:OmpC Outer membrane protein (porin) [Methylophilaceae bacterium]